MPDDAWYIDIHKRLCEGDLTAFAELAEEVMESLVEKLSRKYPNLRDPDLPTEAVADALMDYSKRPEQFDPTQRGLFGFLVMSAEGDLKNALAKIARRKKKEIQLESVEVDERDGNTRDRTDELDAIIDSERIQDALDALFDDPKDRAVSQADDGGRTGHGGIRSGSGVGGSIRRPTAHRSKKEQGPHKKTPTKTPWRHFRP